ncbi:MAG: iron ABC transporter permease [Deltaproteobacteria bacterium]|nr:iron ABC transporter permease [Deltaproteobacteria bacterium]
MTLLTKRRLAVLVAGFALLLSASIVAGLAIGPSGLSPQRVIRALAGGGSPADADIVLRVRLPRVVLAALVGASLSVAGVLFQALLRNPLADPYVLGVSGGAALGAVAVMAFGASLGLGYAFVAPAAFLGALAATILLFGVAGARGRLSSTSLLLTGVVFNAFASAAIVFVASLAGLAEGTSIFLWLIGNLSSARTDEALGVAVFLVAGLGCAVPLARGLDLLALGEEPATQLGVDVPRMKRLLLLATALMVGAAVAVSGLVGFVGLIIPHLLRLVLGPGHRLLIPAGALGGAAFLVLCDTVARSLLDGRELPVGAVTALVGGPLFLVLLRREQGGRGMR